MANASTVKEPCQEKLRLLRAYSSSTEEYLRAVRALGERTTQECGDLRISAEKARRLAEQSLDALDRHRSDHRCG